MLCGLLQTSTCAKLCLPAHAPHAAASAPLLRAPLTPATAQPAQSLQVVRAAAVEAKPAASCAPSIPQHRIRFLLTALSWGHLPAGRTSRRCRRTSAWWAWP